LNYLINILSFIIGASFGSFVNVLVDRLKIDQNEKNILNLSQSSHCMSCQKRIAWYDLIPVISYFWLTGRCRSCGKVIPARILIVEIVTGLLGLAVVNYFGVDFGSLVLFLVAMVMVAMFVYDLKYQLIPNYFIYAGLVLAVVYNLHLLNLVRLEIDSLIFALLVGSGFFYILHLISSGKWMGFGDVKLMLVIGLILGWPLIMVQLYISFIVGGIVGLGLLIFGKQRLKSKLAFGPFLIAGYFISLFWGEQLINIAQNYLFY